MDPVKEKVDRRLRRLESVDCLSQYHRMCHRVWSPEYCRPGNIAMPARSSETMVMIRFGLSKRDGVGSLVERVLSDQRVVYCFKRTTNFAPIVCKLSDLSLSSILLFPIRALSSN
jgi:hypothetical protein